MTSAAQQKPPFSYVAHVSKGKDIVYDVRAHLNGEGRYFIIKVNLAKHQAFLQAIEKDQGLRLEDFGEILHRGWNEPPYEVQLKYDELYGMYPDAEKPSAEDS